MSEELLPILQQQQSVMERGPIPIPPISIEDLLNQTEVIRKKENDDKIILENISNIPQDTLKNKLISWALAGFPMHYEIYRIDIVPPLVCSDNVTRTIFDYITFCSGKAINEHIDALQAKVTGIRVGDIYLGGTTICIVVSKV